MRATFGALNVGQQFASVASIQHTGTTITATVVDGSGAQTTLSGSLNNGQFLASLAGTAPFVRMSCPGGAADTRLSAYSVTGTATATLITGTAAQTNNVYIIPPAPFPQSGQFLDGSFTIQSSVRMTKR